MTWETIIGLEIHVALNTKSKLFSLAPNRFGDAPNTNITEVCTGQPGALPVLNKEAVHKAVLFGCAIQSHVAPFSKFDRKSYFYPDSPRNFQITQFDQPILVGGEVIAHVDGQNKTFAVTRAHLEDDAGMLKHFSTFAGVDYNRAGVPLLEIVSEPCMHHPKEAVAYAMAVKAIIEYIGVSDGNMEEGSMRMDANVSVRLKGEKGLRNKVEIKNMNSFSNMEKALESEIKRQVREYTRFAQKPPHEVVSQATYRWDPERKETLLMRRKEDAEDYRYFPEPDLPPVVLSEKQIEEAKKSLPELPFQRFNRYVSELQLSPEAAFTLTSEKALSDYFEKGLSYCKNPKGLCNWIIVEFAGRLKNCNIWDIGIAAENIAHLVELIDSKKITGKIAKQVAHDMLANPKEDCRDIVAKNPDYQPLHDTSSIEPIVEQVLKEHSSSVADYRAGKAKAFGHLVGQVMKLSKGKASPQVVNELLKQKLL